LISLGREEAIIRQLTARSKRWREEKERNAKGYRVRREKTLERTYKVELGYKDAAFLCEKIQVIFISSNRTAGFEAQLR
jgi:hypothetical protein